MFRVENSTLERSNSPIEDQGDNTMSTALRFRFWLEAAMFPVTGSLLTAAVVWPHWIEGVSGISPDSGDGSMEWLIVSVLLVVAVMSFLTARYEWRVRQRALQSES